jgi:hypothetical protein
MARWLRAAWRDEMAEEDKAREMRLRRQAKRQGLYLGKSRRRDPRVQYYGTWYVVMIDINGVCAQGLQDLDAVEAELKELESRGYKAP